MAMKVDQASSIDPRSAALTGNPKVSKFGMKSGFVIPKNKLSGSLVPIFRGAVKGESDTVKEESSKQTRRKTKWGIDLTEDTTVRRGRALAYQTRVEQITKQLKSGVLESGDEDLSAQSPSEVPNDVSSTLQAEHQKSESLELERREAIGEILKLNPSFKAPLDYKPLMKEAFIPVPVKLYPGLNFVGLILGPGSNTQKRLEEETGATIRIQGIKEGSADKVEITSSDNSDAQGAYEELYIHVSADTFEKVDTAVSLIELLVTPVSGNSATVSTAPSSLSGDSTTVLEQGQNNTFSHVMPSTVVNQGMMQSVVGTMQPGLLPQGQFHPYPAPWFPSGPMRPPSNFNPSSNSSAPLHNNAIQFASPLNPSNVPQFFVGHPPSAGGSHFPPRNPVQGFQWPHYREAPPNTQGLPLRMHPTPGSQPHMTYPSMPGQHNPAMPHQGTSNQPRTTGPGPGQSQPLSSGWPASTVANPSQQIGMFQRPPIVSQPPMTSGMASSNVPTTVMTGPSGNMNSLGFPARPSTTQQPNTQFNNSITGPNFSFVIHQRPTLGSTSGPLPPVAAMPTLIPPSAPSQTIGPTQAPNQSMVGPTPSPPPLSAASPQLSINPNFTSSVPPISPQNITPTTPRPQRPSSGDFTFKPLGSPRPVSQTILRPGEQPSQALLVQPPPALQTSSYRPPVHNPGPQLVMQGFPNTQPNNQMVQPQSQMRPPSLTSVLPFTGNPSPRHPPPRFPEFGNPNPLPTTATAAHMGPRMTNYPGRYPPPMVNTASVRAQSFLVQQYGGRPASSPSGNQVYDPFSPTSASAAPQQPENPAKVRKQEDDPEYDDLMASVGVR